MSGAAVELPGSGIVILYFSQILLLSVPDVTIDSVMSPKRMTMAGVQQPAIAAQISPIPNMNLSNPDE